MPYKDPQKRRENDAEYRKRNRQAIRDRSNSPQYKAMRRRWLDKNRAAWQTWERGYRKNARLKILAGRKRCDICRCIPKRRLIIDHDHAVALSRCNHAPNTKHCVSCRRGVLCDNCNTAIGKFHEDLKILGNGRAGRYLRKWIKILRYKRRTS